MLDYLVTSRTRRALLHLLWVEGRSGSVSALARESGVNFSAVHRELDAMKDAGLALAERLGPTLEFHANRAHSHAGILLALLALPDRAGPLTAPAKGVRGPSAEDALLDELVAAHGSEARALALPNVIWRQRESLDYRRLTREAIRRNEAHALGF